MGILAWREQGGCAGVGGMRGVSTCPYRRWVGIVESRVVEVGTVGVNSLGEAMLAMLPLGHSLGGEKEAEARGGNAGSKAESHFEDTVPDYRRYRSMASKI